jgi:hypothetical protein
MVKKNSAANKSAVAIGWSMALGDPDHAERFASSARQHHGPAAVPDSDHPIRVADLIAMVNGSLVAGSVQT